jgi:hypothetical protein
MATIFCVDRDCRADLATRFGDEIPGGTASDQVEAGG